MSWVIVGQAYDMNYSVTILPSPYLHHPPAYLAAVGSDLVERWLLVLLVAVTLTLGQQCMKPPLADHNDIELVASFPGPRRQAWERGS